MKLNKFTLTLTALALLPAFAYAGTDAVATSFERDLNREPTKSVIATGEPDALTVEFYAALNGTIDPVLASFERDMNREPVATVLAGSDDPLSDLFYAALYGRTDTELASSERDSNREPAV